VSYYSYPSDALADVAAERRRQDAKWGPQNHPDGTGPDVPYRPLPAYDMTEAAVAARDRCKANGPGEDNWRDILTEEIYEAYAEDDPQALRAELVQVAAVAVAWIEAIDRRQAAIHEAPRDIAKNATSEPTESRCGRCGGPNIVWSAPSPLYNEVMRGGDINAGEPFHGFICPTCFACLAEEKGIATFWRLSAERVHVPLATVTPSGRMWDEASWMWVEPGSAARRTWSLPPEPGPEVKAVRAKQALYGQTLWRRANRAPLGQHWELRRDDGALLATVVSWLRLLERFGPLTDATETGADHA
jgi:hypothetical protein